MSFTVRVVDAGIVVFVGTVAVFVFMYKLPVRLFPSTMKFMIRILVRSTPVREDAGICHTFSAVELMPVRYIVALLLKASINSHFTVWGFPFRPTTKLEYPLKSAVSIGVVEKSSYVMPPPVHPAVPVA